MDTKQDARKRFQQTQEHMQQEEKKRGSHAEEALMKPKSVPGSILQTMERSNCGGNHDDLPLRHATDALVFNAFGTLHKLQARLQGLAALSSPLFLSERQIHLSPNLSQTYIRRTVE